MTRLSATRKLTLSLALAAALAAPLAAHAHRAWLLPSGTVFSGDEPWVTVDAAVSNDIFFADHNAGSLDGLVVIGPDGKPVQAANAAKGRYRSVFDVKLAQPGTYRIALVSEGLMASYKVGNESKRVRGSKAEVAKAIPANATEVRVTQAANRIETFVTAGKPTTDNLKPTGSGIELVPVTHPNDLVAGEAATFRFVDGGKPAAGYNVIAILEGKRYRSELGEMTLKTDANGEVSIKWPAAGKYWLNVTPPRPAGAGEGPGAGGAGGPGMAQPGPAGTLDAPARRSNYSLTLEVLPS